MLDTRTAILLIEFLFHLTKSQIKKEARRDSLYSRYEKLLNKVCPQLEPLYSEWIVCKFTYRHLSIRQNQILLLKYRWQELISESHNFAEIKLLYKRLSLSANSTEYEIFDTFSQHDSNGVAGNSET